MGDEPGEESSTGKGQISHYCEIERKNGGFPYLRLIFAATKTFHWITSLVGRATKVKAQNSKNINQLTCC
jgi:hypothetical protein